MSIRGAFALLAIIFISISSCDSKPNHEKDVEGSVDSQELLDEAARVNLENIEEIYAYKCSICHGDDGIPVIIGAPNLKETVLTVEERVAIIAYGKNMMPPQKDVLDMATIRGLAVYLNKFQN